MVNVKLISMNCENVCGYLCFCCADAVDCGVEGKLTWMNMDRYGLEVFVLDDGYGLLEWWFSESGFAGLRCPALWFPAYAGMTVRDTGMTVRDAGMTATLHSPSGLRIKSAMTVPGVLVVLPCCMPRPVDTALKPV